MNSREPRAEVRRLLRERLRAGDPAANEADREDEALAQLRERIRSGSSSRTPTARLRFLVPLATAALLAVWVSLPRDRPDPQIPIADDPGPAPAQTGATGDDRRQLHFETPGGTRIVWMLDPNLTL
jgi:hypothetical protein